MNKTSEKIGILSVSMIVGTAAAIYRNDDFQETG